MTGINTGGILRVATADAYTAASAGGTSCAFAIRSLRWLIAAWMVGFVLAATAVAQSLPADSSTDENQLVASLTKLESYSWTFGRRDDPDFQGTPKGWKQRIGDGFPKYVGYQIVPRDEDFGQRMRQIDTELVRMWSSLRPRFPSLPALPPSISDMTVDRYLRIDLDGGQLMAQSPTIEASRMFQYRFSADIMTQGLRHDSARAELIFLDERGDEIAAHSTDRITGTTKWTTYRVDLVRPPVGAKAMQVRVHVQRSDDGLEDIRGTIGFDNLRIDQYPQLQITTNQSRGVYRVGESITTTAKIMGLPSGDSTIQFALLDHAGRAIAKQQLSARHGNLQSASKSSSKKPVVSPDSEVTWALPRLEPGFYRVAASIVGKQTSTLSTEVTLVVIDDLVGGPPHGPFGWTLPRGSRSASPRELATWLSSLGVAWVKYPCWIAPDDTASAEEVAALLSRLQDSGLQTIGMLDAPPESQIPKYQLRGRRDIVAAQVFRDVNTWQPLLEPIMTRLTLKVRTWQLGGDRDFSFLGRPRLQESIQQISTGLQGFGQPIEVAISWPWLEEELHSKEASWQAVCRSSDPPLAAHELDAFLELGESQSRGDGPRTWLLLDPINKSGYDRDARIRDLVLRMATVRSHRVQAAFVSDPYDPQNGLLRPSGRPDELLLPWRTTSRLIGNLRKTGSLQLQSGAQNAVFVGGDRAVLMLWSAEPAVEKIYLGDNVQMIDVWGRVTDLPIQPDPIQPCQHVSIGRVPIFIVGADPSLLAFRMSVELQPKQLDSLLGQVQSLSVKFANPTRDSLVGTVRILTPESWSISSPIRNWETLSGRSTSESFDVVLGNTAKIGDYDVPLQFELETVPPKLITVHRNLSVGPEGLEIKITTRLLRGNEMRVQIEMTNRSTRAQSYDCLLFPPPGRQYKRRFVTIQPGEMIRREIFWPDGDELVGKRMLLRSVEQDGNRVLNYPIDVTR
ncbi:hypothetical protein Poly51_16240 [Rubripirellula tenax]|uniref:Alpha-galactosidase NEW3 domain-containing protein n=1 Tax=Rubripirellula tenax TaxID=2528015 RepID=A0A5C6FF64_9BACT|nr:hypothetical protein [Rubripirellula tenax]TWU58844.1 hypothetical protein Poly51_16240 [Rubripirellula tenax]